MNNPTNDPTNSEANDSGAANVKTASTLRAISLDEIAHLVKDCTDCPLSAGRTNAVPGEGPADARLLFIGEGPGQQEDRQGRPFVGATGKFLEELLASIGLTREQVFIANMIKCRPPQNRDPSPDEMSSCSKYLDRQIELLNPELIVTLGRFSLGRFFPGESITRARGKVREKEGRFIYPIMHPAAALHRQENRSAIMQDFKNIPQVLEKLAQDRSGATQSETSIAETHEFDQAAEDSGQMPETPTAGVIPAEQLDMFSMPAPATEPEPRPTPVAEPVAPTTQQLSLF
ncbi:MAG TPA: uracil-DNA glycosylase [Dehalococcoidia bacterium]|nr:uracil-DNA glycosylase [Dehalococcoidia bacterium]